MLTQTYIFLFSTKDVSWFFGIFRCGVDEVDICIYRDAIHRKCCDHCILNYYTTNCDHYINTPCPCLTSRDFLKMEAEEKSGYSHIFHSHNLKHESPVRFMMLMPRVSFEDCECTCEEIELGARQKQRACLSEW